MTTYKDGRRILSAPLSDDDLRSLRIGDIFYLSGTLTTGRDAVHRRVVEEGRALPVDLRGGVLLHAGPIVRPLEGGGWEMVSIGPTTSMRMEKFEYEFVKATDVRLLIGKGGMKENAARACRDFGCVHCVMPAGCAVAAALSVEEIVGADWLDLGMPEALWTCRVREFGPLIVSIDAEGRNYFEEKKAEYRRHKDEQLARLAKELAFRE
ncbi:MAG: L(+)-tartrate dehydratase subunit beta [Oscillospiraceae bacterium]|nr:L(+)-tartrate dehydratase subunit beta [Oscillospiraceae bacterium]